MPPINPILGWVFFAVAMILCGCLMFAALSIEITRKGKDRPPAPDFPEARIKDVPYSIALAAADHERMMKL